MMAYSTRLSHWRSRSGHSQASALQAPYSQPVAQPGNESGPPRMRRLNWGGKVMLEGSLGSLPGFTAQGDSETCAAKARQICTLATPGEGQVSAHASASQGSPWGYRQVPRQGPGMPCFSTRGVLGLTRILPACVFNVVSSPGSCGTALALAK